MKKSTIITLCIFAITILIFEFFPKAKYTTIEDVEKLFQKHDISYASKPVEQKYQIDEAQEQRLYEIEDSDIYIYLVNGPNFEQVVVDVFNNTFEGFEDRTVATVDNFIFVHFEKNTERFYDDLYGVFDEIWRSSYNKGKQSSKD